MFEDIPAMSLTHNKSLINCNSHSEKLIWKFIQLPRCCSEKNLVEVYFQNFFRFIKRLKSFLLSLKKLFTISITSAPFNSDWLANFWRWATLIGSFELNINASNDMGNVKCGNIFRRVQNNLTIASNYQIWQQFNCKNLLIVSNSNII